MTEKKKQQMKSKYKKWFHLWVKYEITSKYIKYVLSESKIPVGVCATSEVKIGKLDFSARVCQLSSAACLIYTVSFHLMPV